MVGMSNHTPVCKTITVERTQGVKNEPNDNDCDSGKREFVVGITGNRVYCARSYLKYN
jgi:hypothetical protein